MKKSLVLLHIFAILGAFPAFAQVQPPSNIPRIGFLTSDPKGVRPSIREGFRDFGYVEGKNIIFKLRIARGMRRGSEAASELVALRPDVIVVTSTPAARAIRKLNRTIPIVFMTLGDPVRRGLVKSFARPGGNTTGITGNIDDFRIKALDVLKAIFPGTSSVVVVKWISLRIPKEMRIKAKELGINIRTADVKDSKNIDNVLSTLKKDDLDAIIVWTNVRLVRRRKRIVELAGKSRIPTIYDRKIYVEAGGLMSYGPDQQALQRRIAYFVDKILKGANAGDLPVERLTKGELVINLKIAKKQGFTIPAEELMFADEVIR